MDTCGLYMVFEGHINFGTSLAIIFFLSHDADSAFNDTIAFVMLMIVQRYYIAFGASASISSGISIMALSSYDVYILT